jgi:hypothetical protein
LPRNEHIVVEGYTQLDWAFRKVSKEVDPQSSARMRGEFKAAAEPVASSAREKISRFEGASLATIHPVATARGIFVVQDARKVSGLRGDFGNLQLRTGLEPALEENKELVLRRIEHALDRVGLEAGF